MKFLTLTVAATLAVPTLLFAAEPASAPKPNTTIILPPIEAKGGNVTIPPEMIEALKRLTDDDYQTRQDAVAKLQQVMSRQFQQMVVLQNLMLKVQDGLAAQLREMTQGTGAEIEGQARVAGLMEFNSALSRWAIDVMALPEKERNDLLAWGMKDEHLPLIARAYARTEEVRGKAARELAKMDGPEVEWLLMQLLVDPSREVALHALDAVYDRKPSSRIVSVLWDRATAAAMNQIRQRQGRQKTINVRGRMISVHEDPNAQARSQDAEVAVDILIKYNDPQITERLDGLFKEISSSLSNPNDYRCFLSPNYGDAGKAISRLVDHYKPKEAIVFLVKVLGTDSNDGSDTTVNNDKMRYNSRIDAIAMLAKMIGQDPDDYGIKKLANWGDRWLIKGGATEEAAAIKKLQAWWKENQSKYETAPSK